MLFWMKIVFWITLLLAGNFADQLSEFVLPGGEKCYYDGYGGLLANNQCFLLKFENLTSENAREYCYNTGGHLTDKENEYGITILKKLMLQAGWYRTWLGGYKQTTAWHWTYSNILVKSSFQAWNITEPDDQYHDCAAVIPTNSFKWSGLPCGEEIGYICEAERSSPHCRTDTGLFYEVLIINNRCFMISTVDRTYNWFKAKQECERYGAKLSAIDNFSIHEKILDIKPGLGQNVRGYWIGATKAQWKWYTGKNITTFFWERNQPRRNGSCIVLEQFPENKYRWANWNCSNPLNYMCQYNMTEMSMKSTTSGQQSTIRRPATSTQLTAKHTQPQSTSTRKIEATTPSSIISTTVTDIVPPTRITTKGYRITTAAMSGQTQTHLQLTNSAATPVRWNTTKQSTTTPQIPQPLPKQTLCHLIDLCIIISYSSKVTDANWTILKTFLLMVTNELDVSKGCYNIAIVYSANNPEQHLTFQQSNRDLLLQYIKTLSIQNKQLYTLSGIIQYVRQNIFKEQENLRQGVKRMMLIVSTAEKISSLNINTVYEAAQAKLSAIDIGAVVVNQRSSDKSLSQNLTLITSEPSNIYQVYSNTFNFLVNKSVLQNVLAMFIQSSPMRDTTEFDTPTSTVATLPQSEDDSTIHIILITVIVSLVVLICLTSVCICVLIKRRKRKQNKLMYTSTLVGHSESSRYEEVSVHSASSSIQSSASHGSSKKKIERYRRSKRKSFPTPPQQGGGITTPWGSMRSDRTTHGRLKPSVTLAGSWFAG